MKRKVAMMLLIGMAVAPTLTFADETHAPVAGVSKELTVMLEEAIKNSEERSENEIQPEEKIVVREERTRTENPEPEKIEPSEDTYVIDITEEEIHLMAVVTEAEAGGCSLDCRQMVADVILNRAIECGSVTEAIYAPGQFSSVWDGGIERHSVPQESTIAVCKQELKEIGYPGLFYFRDSYYHSYGTPWCSIDNMYFSTK